MTSFKTPVIPPIIASLPILVYCWTAELPPITTESSIVTWPPNGTLFAMITLFPILQSCATWEEIMNKQLLPIVVFDPPPFVPGFIVTYSLIVLFSPINKIDFSLLNFRSCGWVPILANGKILVPFPIFVKPSIWTFETNSTSSDNSTSGPT